MSTNEVRVLIFTGPPLTTVANIEEANRYINTHLDHFSEEPWFAVQVEALTENGDLPIMVYSPPEEPVIMVNTFEDYIKDTMQGGLRG